MPFFYFLTLVQCGSSHKDLSSEIHTGIFGPLQISFCEISGHVGSLEAPKGIKFVYPRKTLCLDFQTTSSWLSLVVIILNITLLHVALHYW